MGLSIAGGIASFLVTLIYLAGSLWMYTIMLEFGFAAWWQWIVPIAFGGLFYVGAIKALWS